MLGLSTEQFETMANIIDAVYHCGAMVHSVYSYDLMKPANVLGNPGDHKNGLRGTPEDSPLHLDSLGIPTASRCGKKRNGASAVGRWRDIPSGYGQSKWVAEKLVRIAQSRGVPAAIYRLGLVSGSPQTGAGNSQDIVSRFITTCLQLGCVPDADFSLDLNMLPVDYVSRAILALSLRDEMLGRSVNLVNEKTVSLSLLWESLLSWGQASGFPLQKVPFEKWWLQCNGIEDIKAAQIFYPAAAQKPAPRNASGGAGFEMDLETDRLLQSRRHASSSHHAGNTAGLHRTLGEGEWESGSKDIAEDTAGPAGNY